ncbi:HNH endonuclease family protein [Austwickia chelonae]|uniref:HNH endonuclease family protein n=1 Tax=Austwickia chelonae TaxID=100225 RepID=UPI00116026EA|nr:HNH endonuclease family protein [Austwickia chelonae]
MKSERQASRKTLLRSSLVLASVVAVCLPVTTAQAARVEEAKPDVAAAQLKIGMDGTPEGAKTALAGLTVAEMAEKGGYSRKSFPHWKNAADNGWTNVPSEKCNARNAALHRDGQNVEFEGNCTRPTGKWVDPYTAGVFDSARDIDIDHVVPLSHAWRTGAADWDTEKRTKFANDPLVLVSVENRANRAKGDKAPNEWKPSNTAAHCLYATRWVHVKAKYQLNVSNEEKSTLTEMLGTCSG